jgi:hypothetical protein
MCRSCAAVLLGAAGSVWAGMKRRRALLAALALLVVALAACSDKVGEAHVGGHLLRVGGPAPGSVPLPGTVTAVASGRSTVTTAEAGNDGAFELRLAPGTYTLSAVSPQVDGGSTPCAQDQTVTVQGSKSMEVDVICHIR